MPCRNYSSRLRSPAHSSFRRRSGRHRRNACSVQPQPLPKRPQRWLHQAVQSGDQSFLRTEVRTNFRNFTISSSLVLVFSLFYNYINNILYNFLRQIRIRRSARHRCASRQNFGRRRRCGRPSVSGRWRRHWFLPEETQSKSLNNR